MTTLKVNTTVGEFTRNTDIAYTHAIVWNSPRAAQTYANVTNNVANYHGGGVHGRWVKDRGYATTWHGSHKAALRAASRGYGWDNEATPVGIFAVEAA